MIFTGNTINGAAPLVLFNLLYLNKPIIKYRVGAPVSSLADFDLDINDFNVFSSPNETTPSNTLAKSLGLLLEFKIYSKSKSLQAFIGVSNLI